MYPKTRLTLKIKSHPYPVFHIHSLEFIVNIYYNNFHQKKIHHTSLIISSFVVLVTHPACCYSSSDSDSESDLSLSQLNRSEVVWYSYCSEPRVDLSDGHLQRLFPYFLVAESTRFTVFPLHTLQLQYQVYYFIFL